MYQNNILILIASPILSLSLSGAVMPERTAGDISSSEDESSYEEVVVEEPKPVEPEPELPGDTTSSEETTSDESTKKRTREVEGPRGELRGRPIETRREGRALPEGRDKRPRSPEPRAGGTSVRVARHRLRAGTSAHVARNRLRVARPRANPRAKRVPSNTCPAQFVGLVSFVQDVDTTWEQIWFIFVPRNCKYIISLIKLESF